ncbi:hypothetical protein DERF_007666 [Dermatophagoides farinae]|uniref:Uncharacterized protein n=1 Tax=Dermatophagoides farinae TaxID=6954 RepID=A0A922HZF9_DERFA|nr:hypothetical protein DERF_007666 [Dermatophagoides farinae]
MAARRIPEKDSLEFHCQLPLFIPFDFIVHRVLAVDFLCSNKKKQNPKKIGQINAPKKNVTSSKCGLPFLND